MVASELSCSVVIPTRDRPEALARCLEALSRQRYSPREVIVVDSAPERFPADKIAAQHGAMYLLEPQPGASRARNRGAHQASGDVVAYLDDDCQPEPGWLGEILREFDDPQVAVVTGRIRPAKIETEAEKLFDSIGALDCGEQYRKFDAATPGWFEMANFGGLTGGGNMALRRSVLHTWPGFDERLGRGAPQDCNEEPHAYFSLLDRGYSAVYTPRALVRHPLPADAGELRQRLLSDMRWSAAYLTLLAVEYPRHRGAALRYAWQGLLGHEREWRPLPTAGSRKIASAWRRRMEWAKGPLLYLRMRWQTRSRNRLGGNLRLAWQLWRAGVTLPSIALYPLRRRYFGQQHRVEFHGGATIISPMDEPILPMIHRIWNRHVYLPPGLALKPGDVVVDIGANVGVFTEWAARHPGVRVIALEPSPRISGFLRRNVESSGLRNVSVVEAACSAADGQGTLYASGYETNNSLYPQDAYGGRYEPRYLVETRSLESIFREHGVKRCALLKMNCEGAEYDIILRTPPEVLGTVQGIAMEYHRGRVDSRPEQLHEFLTSAGFDVELHPLHDFEGGYLYATRRTKA